MAEAFGSVKGTGRRAKKDLPASRSLHCINTPTANSGRLSLMSNARFQKVTSGSLERLSFVSEKDENSDLDNYHLEYSTYLLRKAQNHILAKNKQEKEENVKKCFVSLKFEWEDLLGKYVQLSKEIGYFRMFLEIQKKIVESVEQGKKVLEMLKENNFEELLKSLSNSLDNTVNQLQLVDIDKSTISEMFSKGIWGSESEIDECLKKIDSYVSKNKNEVSKIAAELVSIKALSVENSALRERFDSVFQQISNDILETNYKVFTGIVKKALDHREECKSEFLKLSLDCDLDFLLGSAKPQNTQLSFQLSKLETSYPLMPNSSSTPTQN